jgi:hypothetical protein
MTKVIATKMIVLVRLAIAGVVLPGWATRLYINKGAFGECRSFWGVWKNWKYDKIARSCINPSKQCSVWNASFVFF